MKNIIFLSLVGSFFCLMYSCKDKGPDCGFIGFSHALATGNHLSFRGYASNRKQRVADTINGGWEYDEKTKRIYMSEYSLACYEQTTIRIINIIPTEGDTIFLEPLVPRYAQGAPSAYYTSRDGDAIIAYHELLPSDVFLSWLFIERIEEDQTIIGQFNLGFVIEEEYEQQAIDFNLPDTFLFTNGIFEAAFLP